MNINQHKTVVKWDGSCWTGWTEGLPGQIFQEKYHSELIDTLEAALQEVFGVFIEDEDENYEIKADQKDQPY